MNINFRVIFAVIGLATLLSSNVNAASPRINYLLYCSGCHLVNGEGKSPNVPTLRDELGRMVGVAEMRSYLVRIPGASQAPIDDAELAEVINWLLQEFNSNTLPPDFETFTTEEVTEARKQVLADPLSYRTQYWKEYSD
jgi:hypothetical protein